MNVSFMVFLMLAISSTTSARSIGGAKSRISPSPLFGLRKHNLASSSHPLVVGNNILLQLRGGSSLGRPTPNQSSSPFSKTKESTAPRFSQEFSEDGEKEEVKEVIDSFLTRDSRNSFISRVYGILSIQLAFTALVCLLFGTWPPLTNIYSQKMMLATGKASPLLFLPLAGVFASTIAWFRVAISPKARQKAPNKWWWLSIFTVGEAIAIGAISSLYTLKSVITAMGVTALATTTVSMYTIMQKNPKYDLSQWGATLSSWGTVLLVYMMIGIAQSIGWLPAGFLPYSDMLFSCFAVFLFTLYLAYHTKLIVGGKHSKYRMNEKDYVYGAMALYVDIVNIFLHILKLMGEERE
eukprot:CAMPEP_0116147878 /NCGR_PEP_ID=MMETSP0329-20121206/18016_1 /TAXON_ID=697910 /ORGANISM="Pseudo-nitzschia arenysensis, Strain B593" /LENGTH=351 /DNA_ID=CAMNT_0003643889 /DNA_START=219 /DNA_END=1277 /DNA_ORIENTATION=-